MKTILVVDDNAIEQKLAGRLLEAEPAWNVLYAEDGREALSCMIDEHIDLVVTDLNMPHVDGLELLSAVQERFAHVPVIIMTAQGSEQIAITALQQGAAYYVPKKLIAQDLVKATAKVLERSERQQQLTSFLDCMTRHEVEFSLPNRRSLVHHFVAYIQDLASHSARFEDGKLTLIGVALEEALLNAIIHGNLEVSSDLREHGEDQYDNLIRERQQSAPYKQRQVYVTVRITTEEMVFTIRDEGPGFHLDMLPDPTDPENMLKASGRGVLLMRSFMDDVSYNDQGNQVTLTKKLAHLKEPAEQPTTLEPTAVEY